MKYGLFMMPSHPPERDLFQAHQWDLDCLSLADELGFDEAWIGEHFTSPWEPIPAPDLMITQALMRTQPEPDLSSRISPAWKLRLTRTHLTRPKSTELGEPRKTRLRGCDEEA